MAVLGRAGFALSRFDTVVDKPVSQRCRLGDAVSLWSALGAYVTYEVGGRNSH